MHFETKVITAIINQWDTSFKKLYIKRKNALFSFCKNPVMNAKQKVSPAG